MFWRKKKSQAEPEEPSNRPKKRPIRRFFSICLRCIKYLCLLILLCLLAAAGGAWWVTQTESGQNWLVKTANAALAPTPGSDALSFKIVSLTGSLPTDFTFGLEARDRHGVWLRAPANTFVWDWRALPQSLHISEIIARDVDLSRLPDLPPAPPKPPTEPFTIADLQKLLAQGADFLSQKHWWLPEIRIDAVEAPNTLLPENLLQSPNMSSQRLELGAKIKLAVIDNKAAAEASANLKNAHSDIVAAPSCKLDSLTVSCQADIGPMPDGLQANMSLQTEIAKPVLEVKGLPEDFLGENASLALNLTAKAVTSGSLPGVSILLEGPNLDAGEMRVTGSGDWRTGQSWRRGEIDGPLALRVNFELEPVEAQPDSPLAAIKAPVKARLALAGQLPKANLDLAVDCAEIAQSGHVISDVKLAVAAKDVALPLNAADAHALEKENAIDIHLDAAVDSHKITMATEAFFQAIATRNAADVSGWHVGLRKLVINALGLEGAGSLAALLPDGGTPGIDGNLRLEVRHWDDIAAFMPGQALSGDALVEASLQSGAEVEKGGQIFLSKNAGINQQANVEVKIPTFAMRSKTSAIELAGIAGTIRLNDLFGAPALNAKLDARKIAAAGLDLAAAIAVSGPFAGPLKANVSTHGGVNSRIAAIWRPGNVELDTLEVAADIGRLLKMDKKFLAGIRSSRKASITYGDGGFNAHNLDLRMLPSGSLKAEGGIGSGKMDFKLDLHDLQLKPLQAFSGAIPAGVVGFTGRLAGTAVKPTGNFRLDLKNIALPQSPLPPMSIAAIGNLEHGGGANSVLKIRLELDQKTVRAMGGDNASISANVPLLFGPDGVPALNMTGPLAASVRWNGSLGPIWNLLPMADQRLNGRVNINLAASGSVKTPKVTGSAQISKARYENLMFGVLLTDINLNLELLDTGKKSAPIAGLPGGMKLNLNLSDGRGGTVAVQGQGNLDGSNLDIKAKINDLKPLRRRDVHVELSGHAEVSGSATAPAVVGEIIVDKGEVLLDNLAFTGSVTTLPITTAKGKGRPPETAKIQKAAASPPSSAKAKKNVADTAKAPAANPGGFGSLNVKITMPPRFRVEGRGLASIWKADLLVTGSFTDPKISGDISCSRGNFDFLGKNFALTKGVVFFGGGSLANPLVDIDLTNETQDLTAHILVTGPVNKIKLQLTSDPVVPRDEILSRVLFGRSVNDLSRAEALQLAGAVAQLAGFGGGGGILSSAKKALGVDVLRIGTSDTGDEGDNNAGGTNIEMGKYINDYIYMGVQQGLKPDSTAFIIEIEISPRTHLELRTEQNNTWGGVKWKYNY